MDLIIGPLKITVAAQAIESRALTSVNTVTNLPEISRINNKTSEYIAMKFENDWLDRYLRPERSSVVHMTMEVNLMVIISYTC